MQIWIERYWYCRGNMLMSLVFSFVRPQILSIDSYIFLFAPQLLLNRIILTFEFESIYQYFESVWLPITAAVLIPSRTTHQLLYYYFIYVTALLAISVWQCVPSLFLFPQCLTQAGITVEVSTMATPTGLDLLLCVPEFPSIHPEYRSSWDSLLRGLILNLPLLNLR